MRNTTCKIWHWSTPPRLWRRVAGCPRMFPRSLGTTGLRGKIILSSRYSWVEKKSSFPPPLKGQYHRMCIPISCKPFAIEGGQSFLPWIYRMSYGTIICNVYFMYLAHHPSWVRPRRVRPLRWQIKGCQTTEPRTFDSWLSGKVILSTLSFMVHLRTFYLPSVYPIT